MYVLQFSTFEMQMYEVKFFGKTKLHKGGGIGN